MSLGSSGPGGNSRLGALFGLSAGSGKACDQPGPVRGRCLFVGLVLVATDLRSGPRGCAKPDTAPEPPLLPYREGIVGHPSSIDPLTARSQADRDLVSLLFRGLTEAGPDGTVVPDLATWTSSPDGHTYTFTIRDDAYWEDGSR